MRQGGVNGVHREGEGLIRAISPLSVNFSKEKLFLSHITHIL